jgi:hypothetical protein
MENQKLLTSKQAAEYLGMTLAQFQRLIVDREAVPYVRNSDRGWKYFWVHHLDLWRENSATVPVTIKVEEKTTRPVNRGRIEGPFKIGRDC